MDIVEFENELNSIEHLANIFSNNLTPIVFEVVNRTINIPIELLDILVEGDANSRRITFKLSRYFDGIDLSSKNIHINYINALNKSRYDVAENLFVNINDFIFDWVVSGEATIESGILKISIEFSEINSNDEKIYVWQTKPVALNVEETISVRNDAAPPDYSYQKYFYDMNTNSTTYDEIIDTDAPISVIGRTILMPIIEDCVVSKDNLSQIVSFTIPRFFDNVDLFTRVIAIKFINANGDGDRSKAVNVVALDNAIVFGWLIDANVTAKSGFVQFAFEFLGYTEKNEFYVWQTVPAQLAVSAGLDVDSMMTPPTPSWIQSWELETDKLIKDVQSQVDLVVDISEDVKLSETHAKQSEVNSKLSENEAKKQAEIATEKASIANNKSVEAAESATKALVSEVNAEDSKEKAKASEANSKLSEVAADESKKIAVEKSLEADSSAISAKSEAAKAEVFSETTTTMAASAQKSAELSQAEFIKAKAASDTAITMADNAVKSATLADTAKELSIAEADRAKSEADRAEVVAENMREVFEFELYSSLPRPGTTEKIYVIYGDLNTVNGTYRWNGADYEVISGASQVSVDNLTIVNEDDALSTVAIIESNAKTVNKFWRGTKADYDAVVNKLSDTTYFVTDDTSSNSNSVVVWKDIEEKPSAFPPIEHNHDDRYYTESEIDVLNSSNVATRHKHDNMGVLDEITAALISTWNSAVSHITDAIKHITGEERALWNTVSDKADKSEVTLLNENIRQLDAKYTVEVGTTTINNSKAYPFNNSEATVSLTTPRNALDYTVDTEVVSAVGCVGEVEVYDKQLNGFKIRFVGSGTQAVIKYYVEGGLIR